MTKTRPWNTIWRPELEGAQNLSQILSRGYVIAWKAVISTLSLSTPTTSKAAFYGFASLRWSNKKWREGGTFFHDFNRKAKEQVWPLTQFYSIFYFSRNKDFCKKKWSFYTNTHSVLAVFCTQCPGMSSPRATHLMVSVYLRSSGSNTWG